MWVPGRVKSAATVVDLCDAIDDKNKISRLVLPSDHVNDLYRAHGWTALSYAIYRKEVEIVRILLDQENIDIYVTNGENGILAHMTPMNVAKHQKFGSEKMVELLEKHIKKQELLKGRSERGKEAQQRAELSQSGGIHKSIFKEIATKVGNKCDQAVRKMMSRGEVFTNMWTKLHTLCLELKQQMSSSQEEYEKTKSLLSRIEAQRTDTIQKLGEFEMQLKGNTIPQDVLNIIEILAKAEQMGEKQLEEQLKQSNTRLQLEDVGFFLNSLGMAHTAAKLFLVCENNSEMQINLANTLLIDNIPLGDKLDIRFGIDMVKFNSFPPYEKHWSECAICRQQPVEKLLEEYEIQFKKEILAKEAFSSFGIPFLSDSELLPLLEADLFEKQGDSLGCIETMRENHRNHIAPLV